jgi:UDP-galactopyranose mutase
MHPERLYAEDKTVIFREYSRSAGAGDEPYYPIGRSADKDIYEKYQALANAQSQVIFGGRLGTYRYLDMHQAIGAALATFERVIKPRYVATPPAATAPAPASSA